MSTTSTTTDCGCGGRGGCGCATRALERPRYFARQLVTPAELNLGSEYVLERLRRHNRLLHGWGVVCGAQVCRLPGSDGAGAVPWKVKIRPGACIDGLGNEVTIDCERVVDVRVDVTAATCRDPAGEVRDPWCSDVWTQKEAGRVWVAVCHAERRGRPVRTQPTGCGCDDAGCEYSRWLDGYEVRLLDHCPASHVGPPPTLEEVGRSMTAAIPDCPPCPEDPCVVLAAVDVAADGTITAIDNCSCRRMVASLANVWWRCRAAPRITGVKVKPAGPRPQGAKGVTLQVEAENLRAGEDVEADLGPGVIVTSAVADDGSMVIVVDLAEDAAPGARALTLTTMDCSSATWAKALIVSEPKPK